MSDSTFFWHKAQNLFFLQEKGFRIPPFRIIPADQVQEIVLHPELLETILHDILGDFAPWLFAVRSSASSEDWHEHSNAGQYHTEIAVVRDELPEAILKTIDISRSKLESDEDLALILQEYIEPDISGVSFTRDPSGDRAFIVEYHQGRGIDLVGGEIVPETIRGYWTDSLTLNVSWLDLAVFASIEQYFWFPQDIEWCICDGILYILQSRPITTISDEVYWSILFLESNLIHVEWDYSYEKTGVTEVAPRPVPFTRSLLERLYTQGGPIDRAYQWLGITYRARDFLKVFGADLYVDREQELKTLLPAYSLLNGDYTPRLTSYRWIWTTLKNLTHLMRGFRSVWYWEQILEKIWAIPESKNLPEALDQFLRDYEMIFLVNLHAASTFERLKTLLGKEQSRLADVLTLGSVGDWPLQNKLSWGLIDSLIGNSLDIADESPFMTVLSWARESSESALEWFDSVPEWKRWLLQKSLNNAVLADQSREYGRILMVRNLSKIRTHLLELAEKHGSHDPRNIYFLSIDACLAWDLFETGAGEQKKQFESDCTYTLPSSITRHYRKIEQVNLGVSSGKVTGKIVTIESLEQYPRPRILYTEYLSPDLYQYSGQIDGIISRNGWLLSHLSILARESGIPVVIVSDGIKILLWEEYRIDGGNGEIEAL